MGLKRVLIITYYWPPSAGSGVQRWLKFSKYLPDFNWQPVIYTPENPGFKTKDASLLKDVPKEAEILKSKIWEPYTVYQKLKGSKKNNQENFGILPSKSDSKGLMADFVRWVRGNVFIPDPKVYWVKPSVKYLVNYLERNPVDLIVTTGPPHSMHLIGLGIKEQLGVKWIADFRDPWSKLDLLDDYNISPRSRKKYIALERKVLDTADVCLTVSSIWGNDFKQLGANEVKVITNGYDSEDFTLPVVEKGKFIISHFGLMNHLRNPKLLWRALEELFEENEIFFNDVELRLGGNIQKEIIDEISTYPKLAKRLKIYPYLDHEQIMEQYSEATLLLLLSFSSDIGMGNIPGKLFEYLAAKTSILAFGQSQSDVEQILDKTKSGFNISYDSMDIKRLKAYIVSVYDEVFKEGKKVEAQNVQQYERRQLTRNLVEILDTLSNEN